MANHCIPRHALAELVDWLDRHAPAALREYRALVACEAAKERDHEAELSLKVDLAATIAIALDQAVAAGLLPLESEAA